MIVIVQNGKIEMTITKADKITALILIVLIGFLVHTMSVVKSESSKQSIGVERCDTIYIRDTIIQTK